MGYQDELEYKDVLVLLDPREREVLKAIQVHPDRSVLLDGQVINHRTTGLYVAMYFSLTFETSMIRHLSIINQI